MPSVLDVLASASRLAPAGSGGSGFALAPGTAPALSGTAPSFTYTPGGAVDQSVVDYIKANPQARVGGAFQSANGYTFAPTLAPRSASAENGDQGSDYAGFGVNDNKPWYQGQNEYKYDADGKYLGFNPIEDPRKVSWVDRYGPFIPLMVVGGALAAAGAGAGAGAAAGGTAEAGAGAGTAATVSLGADPFEAIAAQNAAGGFGAAGAAGAAGEVSLGADPFETIATQNAGGGFGATSAGGAGTSSVFKSSVDSQLASEQLGITGSQAAADAAATPIPSVSLSGGAAPSMLDTGKSIFQTLTGNPLGKLALQGLMTGIGSALGTKGAGGGSGSVTAPALPPPTAMPSPIASYREQQDSVLQQLSRRGRASTILTKRAGT